MTYIDPYERARRTRLYTDMLKSQVRESGTLNMTAPDFEIPPKVLK